MIVKNESHIIETTLINICSKVKLSYWVISDTGSTDDTKSIITRFFETQNIPGELVEHDWVDFAHNRTLALNCAYQKTDYLMFFDADDTIHGNLVLPTLTKDRYMVNVGNDFTYLRAMFATNQKKWWYTGVVHEYLDSGDIRTAETIQGDYYIESGRNGARNKDEDKYSNDATILETAYEGEQTEGLKSRYAFYCAQSHFDAKQHDKAIEWYTTCLKRPGWIQERCYACFRLGNIHANRKQMDMAQFYWCKMAEIDPERIDGIVCLMSYLQYQGNHILVNALYHQWKLYNHAPVDKLFIQHSLYKYEVEYFNSISAYYAKDLASGYDCCKAVILNHTNITRVKKCIDNLSFYKEYLVKDKPFTLFLSKKPCL